MVAAVESYSGSILHIASYIAPLKEEWHLDTLYGHQHLLKFMIIMQQRNGKNSG